MIRIGSSQLGTILGLDPWGSPMKVWARLHGLVPSDGGSDATRRGNMLELAVASRWVAESGWSGCPGPAYGTPPVVNPAYPWLGVHPDVLVWFLPPAVLTPPDTIGEVKTARWLHDTVTVRGEEYPGWGEPGTDQIPRWYAAQGIALMAACQVETVWFPVFGTVLDDYRVYRLDRNERVVAGVLRRAEAWYERHVVQAEPPMPDGKDDTTWVLNRALRDAGIEREATPGEAAQLALLRAKRATLDDLKAEVERVKQSIQLSMGEARALLDAKGRPLVTWAASRRAAADGPQSRRFLLKDEGRGDE